MSSPKIAQRKCMCTTTELLVNHNMMSTFTTCKCNAVLALVLFHILCFMGLSYTCRHKEFNNHHVRYTEHDFEWKSGHIQFPVITS